MKAGRVTTERDGVRPVKVAERETEANEGRIRTCRASRGRGITRQPLGRLMHEGNPATGPCAGPGSGGTGWRRARS